eukprot:6213636-Pleurochrysis_carterae.AAC.3
MSASSPTHSTPNQHLECLFVWPVSSCCARVHSPMPADCAWRVGVRCVFQAQRRSRATLAFQPRSRRDHAWPPRSYQIIQRCLVSPPSERLRTVLRVGACSRTEEQRFSSTPSAYAPAAVLPSPPDARCTAPISLACPS